MNRGGNGSMGRIAVKVDIANNQDVQVASRGLMPAEQIRRTQIEGIVDTGASYLVLPENVVTQLGLPATQPATVRFADGRRESRMVVEEARLELLGRHGTFKAIVEPGRSDALLGAIVLEDLDFLVDCRTQTLQPRDPNQILAEIE